MTEDSIDERLFRRALLKAASYEWADYANVKLHKWQKDVNRYTSAMYWKEHPDLNSTVENILGLFKLISIQIDRALQASETRADLISVPSSEDVPTPRHRIPNQGDGKTRYQAFHETLHIHLDKEQQWTEELRQMLMYLQSQSCEFTSETFWQDKKLLRSALHTGLSILCLLSSQVAQTIEAR